MTGPLPENDYYRLRAEWLRFKNHVVESLAVLQSL